MGAMEPAQQNVLFLSVKSQSKLVGPHFLAFQQKKANGTKYG
jgi:hypothetical protein